MPRLSFRVRSYAGIAQRAGRSPSVARKLPEQRPRSPRGVVGYGRPLKASPWECGIYDKPSGVVRGECRGGLGGAAAPNRPPSAARRAGGPNSRKRKAPVPAGHTSHLSKNRPGFILLKRRRAYPRYATPPRRRPKLKQSKAPVPAGHKHHLSKGKPCFAFS